jgi:hypothetical protein
VNGADLIVVFLRSGGTTSRAGMRPALLARRSWSSHWRSGGSLYAVWQRRHACAARRGRRELGAGDGGAAAASPLYNGNPWSAAFSRSALPQAEDNAAWNAAHGSVCRRPDKIVRALASGGRLLGSLVAGGAKPGGRTGPSASRRSRS